MGTTNRIRWIDNVKLLSAFMIVILHVFDNSTSTGGYLLGTFGIPLFFMVNGYLLCNREFSWEYIVRKVSRLLRFMAFNVETVSVVLKLKLVVLIVALMTFVFVANCIIYFLYGIEIREVIPSTFRFVTNGGYFFSGMILCKYKETFEVKVQKVKSVTLIGIAFVGWLVVVFVTKMTGMIWASSYYDFPLVWLSCILFFELIKRKSKQERNPSDSIIDMLAVSTTGIYILHPFVAVVSSKIIGFYEISISLPVSIIEVFGVIYVCVIVTAILKKNRIGKTFVEI